MADPAGLRLRQERPSAFGADATYTASSAAGSRARHVAAFVTNAEVAVVAPLRVAQSGEHFADWSWGVTSFVLPGRRWHDVVSGADYSGSETLRVAALLDRFPVALLAQR